MNLLTILSVAFVSVFMLANPAFAADGAEAASNLPAFAGALGIALAAFGGALGQAKVAAAALEGISRNPGASGSMFVPMILGLAFIETLVIFTLIIAFAVTG